MISLHSTCSTRHIKGTPAPGLCAACGQPLDHSTTPLLDDGDTIVRGDN